MDYTTLYNKKAITDPVSGEEIKDLLTLTFVVPEQYQYRIFRTTKEYIARPDLVSLDQYGTTDYVDVICKLNGISNPYELNEGMLIILPVSGQIHMFSFDNDNIGLQDKMDEEAPKAKQRNEKRKPNEAIIGDRRFKVDKDRRVVIY